MAQLGRGNEATRSTPGVWHLCFLLFVVAAVAAWNLLHSDAGSVVNSFAVATVTCVRYLLAMLDANPGGTGERGWPGELRLPFGAGCLANHEMVGALFACEQLMSARWSA
jgi:hypothetical protein